MKSSNLKEWMPCQSYCQMNGAAAAILSFKDANVVFNGPRWCSIIAERELMTYDRSISDRLYSSHIEESDLLFGTEARIKDIVEYQNTLNSEISLLAILTSCSVGLIGDDVNGIVNAIKRDYPIIVLDAGGLTGLFEEGYQTAMCEILKKISLQKTAAINPKRVNLLGYCRYDTNGNGDLLELKRLLQSAGFEVGICPGEAGLELQELQKLPMAALNIVLAPELGMEMALYLQEKLGQPYAVLPAPYGCQQTMEWLRAIGEILSMSPDLSQLEKEVQIMLENVAEQVNMTKRMVSNLNYRKAILCLSYTNAKSLGEALQNEVLEVDEIEIRTQGNYSGNDVRNADETNSEKDEAWLASDYQLLFGSSTDRVLTGNYAHTVYLNAYKADSRIRRRYKTYLGIEGWGMLIQDIVETTLQLYYLREGNEVHYA